MKVGFTGTQSGMTDWQKSALAETLNYLKATEFCHGDCIGADSEANEIAFEFGIRTFTIYPPLNGKKRAWCFNPNHENKYSRDYEEIIYKSEVIRVKWMQMEDYLKRNKMIVDDSEHMISAPKEHQHTVRSGTWATIRYAWKTKKSLVNIPPVNRSEELNA